MSRVSHVIAYVTKSFKCHCQCQVCEHVKGSLFWLRTPSEIDLNNEATHQSSQFLCKSFQLKIF